MPAAHVRAVTPERTFWEKATILHKEAFRTNGALPPRYSRHYYDLFRMGNSPVKERAFSNPELLDRVVEFKDRFYPSGSAQYSLAKRGTLRLLPPESGLSVLADDYAHMRNMIFGKPPELSEILAGIGEMEAEIASLA